MKPVLEVCVDSLASARAAIAGGADRLELCAALAQRMGASPVRNRMDEILPEYLDEVYRLVNARAYQSMGSSNRL